MAEKIRLLGIRGEIKEREKEKNKGLEEQVKRFVDKKDSQNEYAEERGKQRKQINKERANENVDGEPVGKGQ